MTGVTSASTEEVAHNGSAETTKCPPEIGRRLGAEVTT